jgi:hypothetical protein
MLGGITIAHSGLIDTSLNRVAPGLLEAAHLTGGCDAHDAAIAATAASRAASVASGLSIKFEFLPLTIV